MPLVWVPTETDADPTTTIAAPGVLIGDDEVTVTDTASMPPVGYIGWAVIDDEVITVTGAASNPYTIERAQAGTIEANHTAGADFNWTVVPATVIALVKEQVTATDLDAQPASANLTALAAVDDGAGHVVASDGSGWLSKSYAALWTALAALPAAIAAFAAKADKTAPLAGPVSGSYSPSNDEFGTTTLSSGITNSALLQTLPLASASNLFLSNFTNIYPLPNPIAVKVDNEWIVGDVDETADTFTIRKRGVFGSSRASHLSGAVVSAKKSIEGEMFFIDSSFPHQINLLYASSSDPPNIPVKIILPPNGVNVQPPTGNPNGLVPAPDGKAHGLTVRCDSPDQLIEVYPIAGAAAATLTADPIWRGTPMQTSDGFFDAHLILAYTTQNGSTWSAAATSDVQGVIEGLGDPNGQGLYYSPVSVLYRQKDGTVGGLLWIKTTDASMDTGWDPVY